MNEQLEHFPNADANDKLVDDELKEILEFALPKTWRVHMTLSRFLCTDKTSKEILEFCKEIEGLEAEHGSLAIAGVTDNRKLQSTKNSTSSGRKRKRDSTRHSETQSSKNNRFSSEKGKKYCPVHGWCSHTAEECILLKDAISNGKKKYTEKKSKFPSRSDKKFSKQEVSVMISSACDQAVNRALEVHQAVTSKKRKVSFHTAEGDETLDATDIQQQVEGLKLYRETKNSDADDGSSSESSSGSNA